MTVRVVPWCLNCGLPEHASDAASTRRYIVEVTCPRCGADVDHVTAGQRWHWQQAAAIKCSECSWRGVLNVELATIAKKDEEPRRVERERRAIDAERRVTPVVALAAGS